VRQIQPDLILLDLKMPIMDGWSFVTQSAAPQKPADASCQAVELTELQRTVEQQLDAIR